MLLFVFIISAELAASPRAVDKLHSIYDRLPRASSIATNIAVATQPLVAASTNSLPRLVSVVDAEVNEKKSSVASAPLERSIVNASTRSTTSSTNPKLKPAQFLPLFTPRGQQAVLAMAAVFKDTNGMCYIRKAFIFVFFRKYIRIDALRYLNADFKISIRSRIHPIRLDPTCAVTASHAQISFFSAVRRRCYTTAWCSLSAHSYHCYRGHGK